MYLAQPVPAQPLELTYFEPYADPVYGTRMDMAWNGITLPITFCQQSDGTWIAELHHALKQRQSDITAVAHLVGGMIKLFPKGLKLAELKRQTQAHINTVSGYHWYNMLAVLSTAPDAYTDTHLARELNFRELQQSYMGPDSPVSMVPVYHGDVELPVVIIENPRQGVWGLTWHKVIDRNIDLEWIGDNMKLYAADLDFVKDSLQRMVNTLPECKWEYMLSVWADESKTEGEPTG